MKSNQPPPETIAEMFEKMMAKLAKMSAAPVDPTQRARFEDVFMAGFGACFQEVSNAYSGSSTEASRQRILLRLGDLETELKTWAAARITQLAAKYAAQRDAEETKPAPQPGAN